MYRLRNQWAIIQDHTQEIQNQPHSKGEENGGEGGSALTQLQKINDVTSYVHIFFLSTNTTRLTRDNNRRVTYHIVRRPDFPGR